MITMITMIMCVMCDMGRKIFFFRTNFFLYSPPEKNIPPGIKKIFLPPPLDSLLKRGTSTYTWKYQPAYSLRLYHPPSPPTPNILKI